MAEPLGSIAHSSLERNSDSDGGALDLREIDPMHASERASAEETLARRWYLANQAVEANLGVPSALVGRAVSLAGVCVSFRDGVYTDWERAL